MWNQRCRVSCEHTGHSPSTSRPSRDCENISRQRLSASSGTSFHSASGRSTEVSLGSRCLRQWSAMSPELRQVALTAVPEGSGQLVLREIEDRDLGVLFEHSSDRDAIRMAAFTSPEFDDRTSFERRWARLRSDSSTTNRVIEIDGRVVGHIASFDLEGRREVTYWIGREDWGRGIATRALQEFLQLEATRPLYAGAASDNAASIRVLTKCGFVIVGEGRGFAYGRNEETDEVVLRLDA